MSRHDQIKKFQNFTAASMTGTTTVTSSISSIQFLDDVGLQWVWSGSPVGNFEVLVSADYDPTNNVAGNWVPLIFTYWNGTSFVTSSNVPTSLSSPYYVDISLTSAPWIKCQYTNISGSGTLNGFLTAKGL